MCFGSREKGDGGMARSRDIDKQLRQDEKKMAKEVKLLLLGTYEPWVNADGTSFSLPNVSGGGSQCLVARPSLNALLLEDLFEHTELTFKKEPENQENPRS